MESATGAALRRVRSLTLGLARGGASFLLATFLAFALVDAGDVEPTWAAAGKTAAAEDIAGYREARGYDRSLFVAYGTYLERLLLREPLRSDLSGEQLPGRVAAASLNSVLALLPGLLLGHLLALALAVVAAATHGSRIDRAIQGFTVLLMSLAGATVVIAVQYALCSPSGIDWLPVRGWRTDAFLPWLESVAAPTIALALMILGFVLHFDRNALVEELGRPYIDALRGLGCGRWRCVLAHALPNAAPLLVTRLLLSLPSVVVAGSFLIESHFGVPGIGLMTLEAAKAGDRGFLLLVTGWAALLFVVLQQASDLIGARLDPRRRFAL